MVTQKQDLVGILRRFDMDGDAKVSFKEFEIGLKSSLTVFGKSGNGVKRLTRPKSGVSRLQQSPSRKTLTQGHSVEKLRPSSSGRPANQRRRETELKNANSRKQIGPNSNYFITT